MHVTLYKPGHLPVPPQLYGGGQRAVYWLGKALLELGHQVTLIAHPASRLPGADFRPLDDPLDPPDWVKLIPDSTDIVQICGTTRWLPKKPFVIRFGGNPQPGTQLPHNTIFLSQKHAANFGSQHFVHNGLDPDEYSFSERRADYAVFLAKARWKVKNLEGAIQVARQAGIELRVLGSRNWPFNLQKWLPAIKGVRYYGMTGGEEKRELLAKARCLIFPVRWHEPFGIAAIEALASGAYVAATPYGSLPEIVTPQVGHLSACAAELSDAVRNPTRFNPIDCRKRIIEGGFSHLDMARKYLGYYEKILTRGSLDDGNPLSPVMYDPKQLLSWN